MPDETSHTGNGYRFAFTVTADHSFHNPIISVMSLMSIRFDAVWLTKRKEALGLRIWIWPCGAGIIAGRIRAGVVEDLGGWGSPAYTRHDVVNGL